MNEKSMLAAADTLKALRDEKSDLQAKLKDVQERIDSVEAELIQLMKNAPASTATDPASPL